ncbi:uncharacterized protein TRIADDRAFT_58392 [Trichoplax adhaerens]|uniref:Thioredoxin domain-containing protein n=1 Tax=Trichoplax adhaerens TaxID=10228 RepID=B3S1Z4_TRIAD|nr:hypothetical protein TRIADDRAFT_58392 [Trichoplax adhaerens]EDV23592.1 hypothetical protein TRIADDRAFT_58392 [Trichoplax adhaerens]|eukprot:XP_002114502.1 hypothetical protein TRIADDRAFT_58392 [Trichoplax adhaerens]
MYSTTARCGHCQRLLPMWDVLSNKYNSDAIKVIHIAKVDCTQDTPLCSDENVLHYPTIKIYIGKLVKRFTGKRSVQSFAEFIKISLNNPQVDDDEISLKQIGSELTGVQLKKVISTFKIAFIKFYAPWCSHCKVLAPTWKELMEHYKHDKNVFIGSVNCVTHIETCRAEQVKSYPTMTIYTGSKEIQNYQGERNLESLKTFVDSIKASTLKQNDQTADKSHEEL